MIKIENIGMTINAYLSFKMIHFELIQKMNDVLEDLNSSDDEKPINVLLSEKFAENISLLEKIDEKSKNLKFLNYPTEMTAGNLKRANEKFSKVKKISEYLEKVLVLINEIKENANRKDQSKPNPLPLNTQYIAEDSQTEYSSENEITSR
jgi:CRISPR/Cas system-associated endonuclease Cas3-HD